MHCASRRRTASALKSTTPYQSGQTFYIEELGTNEPRIRARALEVLSCRSTRL
jgi:hypothetical protein